MVQMAADQNVLLAQSVRQIELVITKNALIHALERAASELVAKLLTTAQYVRAHPVLRVIRLLDASKHRVSCFWKLLPETFRYIW